MGRHHGYLLLEQKRNLIIAVEFVYKTCYLSRYGSAFTSPSIGTQIGWLICYLRYGWCSLQQAQPLAQIVEKLSG